MKRNFKKKLLCTVLAAAMIIPVLSGCKGDSKTASSVKMDKEHVYKAEYFDMPEGVDNINQMKVSKDKVYVSGYDVKNNYQFQIYELSTDGGETRSVLPKMPDASDGRNISINSFTVDTEGNVYYLENEYTFDDSDPDNPISKSVLSLVKSDPEGKEVFREKIEQKSDNFYASDMIADKEGNIVLLSYEMLLLVDNTGKKIGEIDTTDAYIDNIFLSDDGKLLATSYNYSGGTGKREVKELLVKEKKFGEPVDLPDGTTNASFFSGAGYDFYINDRTNVYGYDMESGKKTQLLNWIDSDMNGSMINNAGALSDGRILCIVNDYMKNKSEMAVMSKVDPKDVVEKKILTLACVWADTNMSSAVIEFNKKNENYRITIKDYSVYNTDEENGYNAGSTKLNTDIISGDVPNILSVNDASSFQSSVSKGLFADLNTYMEKDKDFNKEDYLTNILDAFAKDGKLYTLVPYFDAISIIGKTKNVGSEPGWTLEDLEKTLASMPEGTKIFEQMSRSTIMYYGNNMCMDQFIDWKTGKCSFDNGDFEKLLEFAKQFPSDEEIQNGQRSGFATVEAGATNELEEDELKFRKDKVLLNVCYLYNFRQIHEEQKVNFGDDITFIGFPTAKKNGSAISPGLQLAVSAKADEEAQKASWEFLKMFMEEDFQDELESYWPTKLSSLEKKKEKEQKPDTYTDENGKEIEYENTYTINGKEEKIGQVTDEECEKVMTFLKSLNQVMRYDQKVSEIIDEETGAYFAGQKSAKEVTGIIQNRVQTYLNEIQ